MLLEFPLRGFKHDSQHGDGLLAHTTLRWDLPVQALVEAAFGCRQHMVSPRGEEEALR